MFSCYKTIAVYSLESLLLFSMLKNWRRGEIFWVKIFMRTNILNIVSLIMNKKFVMPFLFHVLSAKMDFVLLTLMLNKYFWYCWQRMWRSKKTVFLTFFLSFKIFPFPKVCVLIFFFLSFFFSYSFCFLSFFLSFFLFFLTKHMSKLFLAILAKKKKAFFLSFFLSSSVCFLPLEINS